MSETVTIGRIAAALRVAKRTAERRAAKEGWPYTEATVSGGAQRRYDINDLPTNLSAALRDLAATESAQRVIDSAPDPSAELAAQAEADGRAFGASVREASEAENAERRKQKEAGLKAFAALPADSPKRKRAKARELVLQALWDLMRRNGLGVVPATELCATAANAGEIKLPAWVWGWMPQYGGSRAVTAASLKNWHYQYREHGIWGLVDGYGNRAGDTKIDRNPALKRVVIGAMLQAPHITPKKVRDYVAAARPDLAGPSVKAYERFMKRWIEENAQTWCYITNPDQWKNSYMAAYGSQTEHIVRLNQLWELDSTPGDWGLTDGRHSVLGVIDLYSRRKRLFVSKTSTAAAVCQVFRRAVLDWGVPEAARTDNGADYVAEQFETVLRDLEVGHELCIPFASEEKGTIERALQTMSHGILDLLPGFIGHNVSERKVIEARKSFAQRVMTPGDVVEIAMSSEELQAVLDQWTEVYEHAPHSGLDGRAPFDVAVSWTEPVQRISDERALDMLLAEIGGTRTVTKRGIQFENHRYDAPELLEHVGREAIIKRDEQDIGRLYVYVDGAFVVIAECAELLGISRRERAAAAKSAQRRFVQHQARELKENRKGIDKNIAQVVLDHKIEQSRNVEALHRPSLDYTTEGLRQAGRAARAHLPPAAPEPDEAARAERAAFQAQFDAEQAAPVAETETPRRRYERWLRLDTRAAAGEALSDADARFHTSYPRTAEYHSMKGFYEDFKDALEGA